MAALRYKKRVKTINYKSHFSLSRLRLWLTVGFPPISFPRRTRPIPVWACWALLPVHCQPVGHSTCVLACLCALEMLKHHFLFMSPVLSGLPPRSKMPLCRGRVLNRVGTQATTAKSTAIPGAPGFFISLHARWQACTVKQVEVLLGGEPHPPCPCLLPDL